MASSAGARAQRRQDSSGDNEISYAAPDALGETSDIEYGTAVFRTSDIAFSDAVLRKVTDPVHIAHVDFDLPNKLGNQYSWVLLLAPSHSSFLKVDQQVRCAANHLTFLAAYNQLAASVKIKTQLERQHADDPSAVKLDLSTIKRSTVAQVQLRERSSLLVHQTCVAPTIGTDRQ